MSTLENNTRPNFFRVLGQTLIQSIKGSVADRIGPWAAAVSYYAILSVVPLCVGTIALASYFLDSDKARQHMEVLLRVLTPQGVDYLSQLIDSALEQRGSAGILSAGLLLFAGSKVFGTLAVALNIVFDTRRSRGFLWSYLVQILLTLSVGGIFLVAVITPWALELVNRFLGELPFAGFLIAAIRWLFSPLMIVAALYFLYRYLPTENTSRPAALIGSAFATVLFLAARPIFVYYIREFASYSSLYGPFTVAVILVVWAWVSAAITLFGGECAATFHALYLKGEHPGSVEARQERRSELFHRAIP